MQLSKEQTKEVTLAVLGLLGRLPALHRIPYADVVLQHVTGLATSDAVLTEVTADVNAALARVLPAA